MPARPTDGPAGEKRRRPAGRCDEGAAHLGPEQQPDAQCAVSFAPPGEAVCHHHLLT